MLRRLFVLAVLTSSTSVFAGDAGCGLGSMIMKDNTKVSQILAITTNATLLSQLFGITTGTSNCSANSFVKAEQEALFYAEANLPSLKVEMARGQGENLTAFAQIFGCQGEGVSVFGQMTQKSYDSLFPNDATTANDLVKSVSGQLSRDSRLVKTCTKTI